jgi:hypothetical protein
MPTAGIPSAKNGRTFSCRPDGFVTDIRSITISPALTQGVVGGLSASAGSNTVEMACLYNVYNHVFLS